MTALHSKGQRGADSRPHRLTSSIAAVSWVAAAGRNRQLHMTPRRAEPRPHKTRSGMDTGDPRCAGSATARGVADPDRNTRGQRVSAREHTRSAVWLHRGTPKPTRDRQRLASTEVPCGRATAHPDPRHVLDRLCHRGPCAPARLLLMVRPLNGLRDGGGRRLSKCTALISNARRESRGHAKWARLRTRGPVALALAAWTARPPVHPAGVADRASRGVAVPRTRTPRHGGAPVGDNGAFDGARPRAGPGCRGCGGTRGLPAPRVDPRRLFEVDTVRKHAQN